MGTLRLALDNVLVADQHSAAVRIRRQPAAVRGFGHRCDSSATDRPRQSRPPQAISAAACDAGIGRCRDAASGSEGGPSAATTSANGRAPKRAPSASTPDRAPVPVSDFTPEFTAEAFPLGFEGSGRPAVDDVARVMRMLHVQELRRLQDSVDATIVSLQEFTANPKTDARLGRVGTGRRLPV